MENTSFFVPSISCNVCCNKIKNSLNSMNGVENVNCDLVTKTVNVDFNENQLAANEIKNKVSSMGYEVE